MILTLVEILNFLYISLLSFKQPQPAEDQLWMHTWFTEIIFQKMCVCMHMYACMYVRMFICVFVYWVSLKGGKGIRKLEIRNGKQIYAWCLIIVLAILLASGGISEGAS